MNVAGVQVRLARKVGQWAKSNAVGGRANIQSAKKGNGFNIFSDARQLVVEERVAGPITLLGLKNRGAFTIKEADKGGTEERPYYIITPTLGVSARQTIGTEPEPKRLSKVTTLNKFSSAG